MNKKIGIFGWKLGENSFGITVPYYEFINFFGDPEIISPVAEPKLDHLDLIIIPGGADLSPISYGHVPSMFTGKSDPIKDYFEQYIIPRAISLGIPLFGICRGHQALAISRGAFLHQHVIHETNDQEKRSDLVHEVTLNLTKIPFEYKNIKKNSKGHPYNTNTIKVNSLHHQIVGLPEEQEVFNNIEIIGTHEKTKHIEALYYPKIKAISVQWHPEEIYDTFSLQAIEYLLSIKKKENNE